MDESSKSSKEGTIKLSISSEDDDIIELLSSALENANLKIELNNKLLNPKLDNTSNKDRKNELTLNKNHPKDVKDENSGKQEPFLSAVSKMVISQKSDVEYMFTKENREETLDTYIIFNNLLFLIFVVGFLLFNSGQMLFEINYTNTNLVLFFGSSFLFVMYDLFTGYSPRFGLNVKIYKYIRFFIVNLVILNEILFLIISASAYNMVQLIIPTMVTTTVLASVYIRDNSTNFITVSDSDYNILLYTHSNHLLLYAAYIVGSLPFLFDAPIPIDSSIFSVIFNPFLLISLGMIIMSLIMEIYDNASIMFSKPIFSLIYGFLLLNHITIRNGSNKIIIPDIEFYLFCLIWIFIVFNLSFISYFFGISFAKNYFSLRPDLSPAKSNQNGSEQKEEADIKEDVKEFKGFSSMKKYSINLANQIAQNPNQLSNGELITNIFDQLQDGVSYFSDTPKSKAMTPLEHIKASYDETTIDFKAFEILLDLYYKKKLRGRQITDTDIEEFRLQLINLVR